MTVPVSIVIPIHNGCDLLANLLSSILRQSVQPLEVIAVDNGSTDGAPELAVRMGARLVAMGRNAGFAAAVNCGVREAKGQGIALINSDVELDPRWLEILWAEICRHNAGFATGLILQYGNLDTIDGAYDLISRGGTAWRAGAGRPACLLPESRAIRFCSATAVIYRASVFAAVGLFAESFESYLEDVDFGLRCALADIEGWYFPAAICRHHGSATFGRWSPRVVRLIARNQIFLIARHYPPGLILRWIWPILAGQLLWGGLALRHSCLGAYLRGKLEGLRHFSRERGVAEDRAAEIIEDSERQIYQLQSACGFDTYWELYFRLAGRP